MDDLQVLQDLENSKVEKVKDKPLQKIKIKKQQKNIDDESTEVVEEINEIVNEKVKKPRTEKQIKAFQAARDKMVTNLQLRKEQQAKEELEKKKELEKKIVSKAIAIKKKEIKQKAILESISDDDTPIEEIKKIASAPKVIKRNKVEEPVKPLSIFERYKFL